MGLNNLCIYCFVGFAFIQLGNSFLIESIAIGSIGISYLLRCKFYECCNKENVILDTENLKVNLQTKLYGQHIARDMIFSAIYSHVVHLNPRKPLVLSLHGLPGSGKNYVVTMIANALFKHGEKSNHYYFFNGRSDFPSDRDVDIYKKDLKAKVEKALHKCERSLFVFDEVDKMPSGVLDILVPFLDYTSYNDREKSKSIFIFLSNTGGEQIVKRMVNLWENGKRREESTIQDFEALISIGAFNEKGGLYRSGTIESKLIDHHVPFLPMEESQVIQCLNDIFRHWGIHEPSDELIQKALLHVTYGPSPHNLYSTSGCKRLDHKVSSIIFEERFGSI